MATPTSRKKSISLPARSHFVSRTEGSFESSSFSVSNAEIRQQTMSWTFRELANYDSSRFHSPAESPVNERRRLHVVTGPLVIDEVDEHVSSKQSLANLQVPTSHESVHISEQVPLLGTRVESKSERWKIVKQGVYSIPAVLLAVMLNLLDAISYGIIVFPPSDSHIPNTGPQAGISMFLVSTIVSQIVYTFGGSAFKGAIGSMMIEVMPFLHIMCSMIEQQIPSNDRSILATIMVCYTMSTLITGTVFLLIGYYKLGGIGFFLLLTGVEITTELAPVISLRYLAELIQPNVLLHWGTAFGVAMILKGLQEFIDSPLLVPLFYATIPVIFYVIVFSIGIPLEELRSLGWLFKFESATEAPFYTYWTYFDFSLVNWTAVMSTIPTQLALTFFGILHVPINVPALSVSTRQDVDLSQEIIGHGISNILSGLLGSTQNYLVYSNSLLYIRCGGDSTISGVLLILASIGLWVKGSFLITFVPKIVVGSLIFHLGFDLMKESLYDTWSVGMHPLEYATIVVIVLVMGVIGFTEGIMVGVILACIFFVVMYARKSIIRETFTGSQLRSTVHRLYRQQNFLDKVGNQIHIIKLQGFMFFGTVNQLDSYIKDLLTQEPHIRFIVLDFSLIGGVDYSGLETFQRIKRNLANTSTHLVICGSNRLENEFRISGVFEMEEDDLCTSLLVHIFETLNDALEWCENYLLSTYYVKSTKASNVPSSSISHSSRVSVVPSTPREQQVFHAAADIINDFPIVHPQFIQDQQPFRFLIQAISDADQISDELLKVFGPKFEKLEFQKHDIVYLSGSEPNGLYIVENGELGLSITDIHGSKIVETLLPGTMVGELELFAEKPRICTLISLSNTTVWCLSKQSYKQLSKNHPHLMLEFVTKISVPFDAVRFYNTVHHWSQLR